MGLGVSGGGAARFSICEGRLTLTTGTPVTTSDVTAAITLYFAPFGGNLVGLHNGMNWNVYSFTEKSISIPASTDTNYDVFLYNNAGTLTPETLAWTNDTTRATALGTQDGVYVKSGDSTRRYLGTIRTTGVNGQCEDSESKRFVWNYYNRVSRQMVVVETTNTWTYDTASWRAANNSTSNRVSCVIGVAESPVEAHVMCKVGLSSISGTNLFGNVGIGIDSVAANSAQLMSDITLNAPASTVTAGLVASASYIGILGVGYHYIQWLEYVRAAAATTFYGDPQPNQQSGLMALSEG